MALWDDTVCPTDINANVVANRGLGGVLNKKRFDQRIMSSVLNVGQVNVQRPPVAPSLVPGVEASEGVTVPCGGPENL